MNPVFQYLRSSVGRKQIMGLSGIILYGFLLVHLVGNLGLLKGPEYFNGYGYLMLHTLSKVVVPIEFLLLAAFILHLGLGFKLTAENRAARPQGYAVNASKGKTGAYRGWMMLTGSWLLVFVIVHVPHFRFGIFANSSAAPTPLAQRDLYGDVMSAFANPWFTGFYLLSFALLFSHLAHGVQSSLQSLGINHPRYNTGLRRLSLAYAALICGGFAALAIWAYCFSNGLGGV